MNVDCPSQKDGSIHLEVGMLEKEVDYDHFDELIEIRKARFQTAQVKSVNIQNVGSFYKKSEHLFAADQFQPNFPRSC